MTHVVGLPRENPPGKMGEIGGAFRHRAPSGEEKLTA